MLLWSLSICYFIYFLPKKEPFHFDVRRHNRTLVLSLTFVAGLLLSRELDNTSGSSRHTI